MHVNGNTFTVEWWELKSAMLDTIAGNAPKFSEHNRGLFRKWLGGSRSSFQGFTADDARRWLVDGYKLDGLQFDNPPILIREKRRLKYLEEGEEFHLDLAYDGDDNVFSDWTKQEVIPGLAVEILFAFRAGTSESVIREYSQFVARALYALEQAGIDLDVTVSSTATDVFGTPERQTTTIRVKRENEAMDFNSWSGMFSPASFRGYMFCARVFNADFRHKRCSSGMGLSVESDWRVSWQPENRKLEISCASKDPASFPVTMMEKQLKEALVAMR